VRRRRAQLPSWTSRGRQHDLSGHEGEGMFPHALDDPFCSGFLARSGHAGCVVSALRTRPRLVRSPARGRHALGGSLSPLSSPLLFFGVSFPCLCHSLSCPPASLTADPLPVPLGWWAPTPRGFISSTAPSWSCVARTEFGSALRDHRSKPTPSSPPRGGWGGF
jgi:hypothetical protein